jgi:hypothetical protein
MPTAFIIHGHDHEARRAVEKFMRSLGVEVVPFHRAPSEANDMEQVLYKLRAGIEQADVVIALLTPDEQATWHDPVTGAYSGKTLNGESLAGWQPRPNVILETGLAAGIAKGKTIVVRVGPVRTISDLAGVLMINLEDALAGEKLRDAVLERVRRRQEKFQPPAGRHSRLSLRRPRWDYYDEWVSSNRTSGQRRSTVIDTRRSLMRSKLTCEVITTRRVGTARALSISCSGSSIEIGKTASRRTQCFGTLSITD